MPTSVFSDLLLLGETATDRFEGPRAPDAGDRLFGGQFLGQGLAAAQRTVTDDREVHSLHAYFLRPGDSDLPTAYSIERVRDGRGFSSRMVSAWQNDKEMFRMVLSFQVPAPGPEYGGHSFPKVPPPEDIALTYNEFTHAESGEVEPWHGADRPMDIRYINPPPKGEPVVEPQLMWMRIAETLPDDQAIHDAGLAYLSDSTLIDHVVLPHGHRWSEPGFDGASLDHAMWFHHRCRADEWLLFHQSVEATSTERGLATGRFFTRSGQLVATCAQEGLLRWSEG